MLRNLLQDNGDDDGEDPGRPHSSSSSSSSSGSDNTGDVTADGASPNSPYANDWSYRFEQQQSTNFGGVEGDWTNPTIDMIKAYAKSRGYNMSDAEASYWTNNWSRLMKDTPGDPTYALSRLERADQWTDPKDRFQDSNDQDSLLAPFKEQFTYEDFKAPTQEDLQNDPGFQASLDRASNALQRSAAARGSLLSGSTAQALSDQTASMTQDAYRDLYSRRMATYQTNRTNAYDQYLERRKNFYQNQDSPFAKLLAMSTLDSQNANYQAGLNAQYAAMGADAMRGGSNRANDYLTGAANAQAAGQVGSANAYSSMFNNLGNNAWSAYMAYLNSKNSRQRESTY